MLTVFTFKGRLPVTNLEAELVSVLKVVVASFILQVKSKSLEKHDSLKIFILSF